MLQYKITVSKNLQTKQLIYFLRAITTETIDIDGLAEHMASHNTPYSKGTIRGIITDMVTCIRELTLDGKAVKIPDLAIFSLGISSTPKAKPEDLTANDLRRAYIKARGTGEFRTAELKDKVTLREVKNYQTPKTK